MAKVTFNLINLKNGINGAKIVNKSFAKKLGISVDTKVKEFISKGLSPVKSEKRFAGYRATRAGTGLSRKEARAAEKNLYPNNLDQRFNKKKRPVNLSVTGSFLKEITHQKTKFGIKYGLIKGTAKHKDMFETHNDGEHKHVPQRKFIPNQVGDSWKPTITRLVRELFRMRILKLLKIK